MVALAKVRSLLGLFGEAHELAPDPAAVQHHLLVGLLRLVGAAAINKVECYGFSPANGNAFDLRYTIDFGFDDSLAKKIPAACHDQQAMDPSVEPMSSRAKGHTQLTRLRRELVADQRWYGSFHVAELRRPARIDDAIHSGYFFADGRAQGVAVHRAWDDAPFSEEDRELVELFHGEFAKYSTPGSGLEVRLSPRERQVLAALCRGERRKEIAANLGLSVYTVHQYVASLYQRLGVSGLPELLAKYRAR